MLQSIGLNALNNYWLTKKSNSSQIILNEGLITKNPKPYLYLSVFGLWIISLIWFGPRLWELKSIAYNFQSAIVITSFVLFILFAWLYGIYNVLIVFFALVYKRFIHKPEKALSNLIIPEYPEVAILYTTYNDLVEESVLSCIKQDYGKFRVYILDDSTDDSYKKRVDELANKYPEIVEVVRRSDREGFKAGNLNHGLEKFAKEKYFAIADADEILPSNFLSKLVPIMESDEKCGFVQANHRSNPETSSGLSKNLGVGIDIHWKYYQPLRNEYGFVMFLGHGALIRRKCWEETNGFPHIVSEDLGFAIHAREIGYRGRFVEDVVCYEDFPESIRSFRIRHMKWTRGTCEFLREKFTWLIKAKNITWTEKLDILFPTLNLPLTLVYFLFMVLANILIPFYFGVRQEITFEIGTQNIVLPIFTLSEGFEIIYTLDFFIITMLTFFAPVLCFVVDLWKKPLKLVKFISHSTALYAALGPLSSIGVITYMISGKAIFLVTGDKNQDSSRISSKGRVSKWKAKYQEFISKSHPDSTFVQGIEIAVGVSFAVACLFLFQISFLGLCLAFVLMPILHHIGWERWGMRYIAHVPYFLIMLGISFAGLSLVGMQTVFFGYGFHF